MINIESFITKTTGAQFVTELETIQSLWSGYGSIVRYALQGCTYPSVVVKHVQLYNQANHPRGWNTDFSHERKVKSYEVETAWYMDYSQLCNDLCRIPRCLGIEKTGDEVVMVLEDIDAAGYPLRKTSVSLEDIQGCLSWLANFHAVFLIKEPKDLWKSGTYWHLETRPDELKVLEDIPLKNAAELIDKKLKSSPYQTIVHGDAKLANFCFSHNGKDVAAVDFQYVGGGCGMKDVAYFIGSCLYEEDCQKYETELLNHYFVSLKEAVENSHLFINFDALEADWRELFPYAWTDFHRFLKGWSPGHWKINSYSEKLARQVISTLL